MNQLPTIVVEELDVPVLLRRDGDGQRGVAEDLVDLAGSAWSAASTLATITAQQRTVTFALKNRRLCKVWPADGSSELPFYYVRPHV